MEPSRRSTSVTGLEYATPELQAHLGRRRALLEANGCENLRVHSEGGRKSHEGTTGRPGEPPSHCSAPVASRYLGGRYANSVAAPAGNSSTCQPSWARWPRTRAFENTPPRVVAQGYSSSEGGMKQRMTMPVQSEVRSLRSTVQEPRPRCSAREPSAKLSLAAAARKREADVQVAEREYHAQHPCVDGAWALKPLSSGRGRQPSDFGSPQDGYEHESESQRLASEFQHLRESLRLVREECRTTKARNVELQRENEGLREETKTLRFAHQENERLYEDLAKARAAFEVRPASSPAEPSAESLLRRVMTTQGSTQSELKNAISAVSALVEEAKRELANREFRERRAAFEALYAAMEAPAEERERRLETALAAAQAAGVPGEDLARAEEKLAELHALTDEQRSQRDRKAWEAAKKRDAFLLVKKDDAATLQIFLEHLSHHEIRWQEWRDYAGRTLWRCAQEVRSSSAQRVMAPLLGLQDPDRSDKPKPRTGVGGVGESGTPAAPSVTAPILSLPAAPKLQESTAEPTESASLEPPAAALPNGSNCPEAPSATGVTAIAASDSVAASVAAAALAPAPALAASSEDANALQEAAKWMRVAFRASVQDDAAKLQEMLDVVPVDIWCRWQNKAGKDLLTLAEERGSAEAYSVLAKAMGLVREQTREAFEERETVWVFLPGEVQPRRATVLQDTPEEADVVRLEYWDGDESEQVLDRCMVRKMGS